MGRNRKKLKENDFNKEIAAILSDAASLAPNQQASQPVQQVKPLKPAVVFHADTCPSKEKLIEKINDEDYSAKFAKLSTISKDGKFECLQYPVNTFHDICINYALNAGMDPEFRRIVEKYGDVNAVHCMMDVRSVAVSGINGKLTTAYVQAMQYGLGLLIDSLCDMLSDIGYDKCADALENMFSCDTDKYASNIGGIYFDIDSYINLIGSTKRAGSNVEYEDACLFVFNSIVNNMLASAQNNVCRIVNNIDRVASSLIGPDYLADFMIDVNESATSIFGQLSKSFFDNVSAALNEIVFVSDALYGNAEIPNAFRYYGEEF